MNQTYWDIICVGGGISSAYMCSKIKKDFPHINILVIEKNDRIGGRLYSVDSNGSILNDVNKDELGGMRFYKTGMAKISKLVDELGLNTIDIPQYNPHNIFYFKGIQYNRHDFRINGLTVNDFIGAGINNFHNIYFKGIDVDNISNKDYDNSILKNINVRDFLKMFANATDNDVDAYISYNGYDTYTDDIQSSMFVSRNNVYNGTQQYVKEGIMEIVVRLFKQSNVTIKLNISVSSIIKDNNGVNIINTRDNNGEQSQYKCKYLIMGLTSSAIDTINSNKPIPINKNRLKMMSYSKQFAYFKCFLQFKPDTIWWRTNNKSLSTRGKSTTDLIIRQVHYYDNEDLLIYNTDKYAEELGKKFNDNKLKASKEVFNMVQKMHSFKLPEPEYDYTVYKYWKCGNNKWKIGANISDFVKKIPDGYSDQSNIYIIGDTYSSYQGWIIGAIETVDIAYSILTQSLHILF